MSERARLVTAEELERFPDDDSRCELVAGRVIRMTPVGFQHGKVVARLMFLLSQHLDGRNLGVVLTEVGFKLAAGPDTVRAPDVAVIRQHRIPSPEPKGFWNGPPDLAVEVLSPDDRSGDVREKVEEYLACGVQAGCDHQSRREGRRGLSAFSASDPRRRGGRLARSPRRDS